MYITHVTTTFLVGCTILTVILQQRVLVKSVFYVTSCREVYPGLCYVRV